ncbi:MAG: hypothetical protein FJZ75_04270 [Bacteroidetes bacterium]|nr:hypothetical protein [Bacteroidota bacterium]
MNSLSPKNWLVLLLFLCALGFLGIYLWDFKEQQAEKSSNHHLSKAQVKNLCPGDILLREGYGLVSATIANRLKGKYRFSHCGVLIETDSGFQVVHTVSSSLSKIDGMQHCSLAEFVQQGKPGSLAVTRLKKTKDRQILVEQVVWYLNQKLAFDHRFDAQDSSTLYCSELIWRGLLRGGGTDITKPHRQNAWGLYSFDMFLNAAFFEVIIPPKNHSN